jgi:hypothetical protein
MLDIYINHDQFFQYNSRLNFHSFHLIQLSSNSLKIFIQENKKKQENKSIHTLNHLIVGCGLPDTTQGNTNRSFS